MIIYIDEYYKNFNKLKKKIDINIVKNTLINLKKCNKNIYIPEKLIYFIIYLIKYDCKFKIINKIIIEKIFKKISHRISSFTFQSTQIRWLYIINIAIKNEVEENILKYFFELYNIYLKQEKCENNNFYKIQAKKILGINIKNYRQLNKYFKLNIYDTCYYIDIIFSKISLKYLSIDYIFNMT
tara:strand:+ start:72 stop:620 length:549 start_codon:yes stop_codon:yes gene_type:complete